MTAPAFATDGTDQGTANAGSVTALFPNSHAAAADSLLVACVSCSSTSAITTPDGWAIIDAARTANGNKQTVVFAKKAGGGETGLTVTTPATRANIDLLEILNVSVADVDAIIAGTLSIQAASSNSGGATAVSYTFPSVDPTQAGDVMMLAFATLSTTPGSNPTWDLDYATVNAPITSCRQFVGYRTGINLGSLGPTATYTNSAQRLGVHFVIPGSAGGVTVSGSQASETDTANAGSVLVSLAGSQAVDADTANAGSAVVRTAGAQASETDTASSGAAAVVVVGVQASETDTANAGSPAVAPAGTQATETDTADGGAATVVVVGSQATETDSANGGTPAITLPGSQAAETDSAATGAPAVVFAGSHAAETDTAFAGSSGGAATVAGNQAAETNTATTGIPSATIAGGQAAEPDTANDGSAVVIIHGSLVAEVESAFAGSVYALIFGGFTTETDLASSGSVVIPTTTPAERRLVIPAETRTHMIESGSRQVVIDAEVRTHAIASEVRRLGVGAEERSLTPAR